MAVEQIKELKEVNIDATLSADEQKAIDKLPKLETADKTAFLTSLKTNTINVGGTQRTMNDMLTEFDKMEWNATDKKYKAKTGETPATWFTTLVSGTGNNDLIYLISTIDNVISTDNKVIETLTSDFKSYLTTLKAKIKTTKEVVDVSTITAADITFDTYGSVIPDKIVTAVTAWDKGDSKTNMIALLK